MSTIFKKIIDREIPSDIVYEDDKVLAFLDIYPIRKGHTLIVPKKEFTNILDGDTDTLAHMMVVAQKIARALMEAVDAEGINIHMNNGHEAEQDVLHAHLHVIPRYKRGEAFVINNKEQFAENEAAIFAEKIKKAIK